MKPRLNKDPKTLLLLGGISSLLWIVLRGVIIHADSPSYIEAAGVVMQGGIDLLRTPAYPFFLGILHAVFGAGIYLYAAIILQHAVFLGSACCLFRMTERLTSSRNTAFYLTLFYVLYPFVTSLNNYILTESFSISGVMFLLYLAFRLHERFRWPDALLFPLLASWLLLLKPALIFIIPVFLVFWAGLLFGGVSRKSILAGLAGTLVAAGCLLGYMAVFKHEYGVFSASSVNTLNQYHIARMYGLLDPSRIEDPGVREDLEKSIEEHGQRPDDFILLFQEAYHMIQDHTLPVVSREVAACTRQQPVQVLLATGSRLYAAADDPLLVSYVHKSRLGHLFSFHISTLFLFLVIYTLLLVRWMIRNRSIPWLTALLYMLAVSQIVVAVYGAQSDWGRLLLPVLPAYLLMVGQLCAALQARSVQFR